METITDTLATDHRRCDELFASAEELVSKEDWDRGGTQFAAFRQAMEHHFSMEEEVVFPAFEQQTGHSAGPTQVMRMEHRQMRQLFAEMSEGIAERSSNRYLGLAETLLMLMQQHNAKEEQMLYRMADQALGDQVPGVLQRMKSL